MAPSVETPGGAVPPRDMSLLLDEIPIPRTGVAGERARRRRIRAAGDSQSEGSWPSDLWVTCPTSIQKALPQSHLR